MSFIGSSAGGGVGAGGGTAISNSLRFRASASAYLSKTLASPTTNTTWTYSLWVKRGTLSTIQSLFSADDSDFRFDVTTNYLTLTKDAGAVSTSTAVFRDPASFMHIVLRSNGTNIKAYRNNEEILSYTGTVPDFNSAVAHTIGKYQGASTEYLDGLLAQICFVDGQALTPGDFAAADSTSGEWKPKTAAAIRTTVGTWGNNGFMLLFNDATSTTTLGYDRDASDTATGGNNWTLNNISVTSGVTYDAFIDSPNNGSSATQPVGNYATLNPLIASAANISYANLRSGTTAVQATLDANTGVGNYWEVTAAGSAPTCGTISATGSTNTVSVTANKTFGFRLTAAGALDYINITDAGAWTSITTGLTGAQFPYGTSQAADWNFGQRPFTGTPSGKALCTANLGTPAIAKGSAHFFAKTRTGTGSSYSVTGLEFSPDFVWVKGRSGATDNALYDAVRGVQKQLESNSTGAETTETTGLTAFNSDGYTAGALAQMNTNTATYIDWMWKANGAGSSNTSGSITSTVSANTTAGISVVTYSGNGSAGATFGHGLGAVPKMIIIKNTFSVTDWIIYHASLGATKNLAFDTAAATTSTTRWNDTAPTSTLITLGTSAAVNENTRTHVAYVFAEIAGFSKFGSYTGNGSTDGPFVYCGFRPRWLLVKQSSAAGVGWRLLDTARDTYNVVGLGLVAQASDAETSGDTFCDITSNGFKVRQSTAGLNTSTATYIFAAFAESPLQYSNAR